MKKKFSNENKQEAFPLKEFIIKKTIKHASVYLKIPTERY